MVLGNIQSDLNRFKEIVRGRIRKDLRGFVSQGEYIGRKGKDLLSIPIPRIEIPHFQFGPNEGGVGQGEGDAGDGVGEGAGDTPAEHLLEVEIAIEDILKILAEELELPRIQPKGRRDMRAPSPRYRSIRRVGPEGLRHRKRSYQQALRRSIAAGTYDSRHPKVIPVREDFRYRSWQDDPRPLRNAVVIYMMDVSGSMGDEQKHIVRSTAFWIDAWLKDNYQGDDTRFIIHDARAREVDRETFFRTRENGGTLISSAYSLASHILERDYPADDWNVYPFHFSDGDNWSGDDTTKCVTLLRDHLLKRSNLFCYGQVESTYGSGRFLTELTSVFEGDERLAMTTIPNRDGIIEAIRCFLGTGK